MALSGHASHVARCPLSGANRKTFTCLSLPLLNPQSTTEAEAPPALLEWEDCTPMAWYPSLYAPRTGGAYDSHHRTAGITGRTRRWGGGVAARGARAAGDAGGRILTVLALLRGAVDQVVIILVGVPGTYL